ncbi:MAG: hypothetical protein WA954_09940 [Parerythrobacter sp.]
MTTFLVVVLLVLMALVVVSLVKGIIAFLKTTKVDLENQTGETMTDMQALQNKAMFNRIKYQALAIVVVAVIMMIAK